MFQPIRWSSEHTLQDQMDRLSAAGCPAGRGHTYSDVDTMDDVWQLFRLCQDMADRGQEVPCYETFEIVKQLLLPTNGYEICR